jgi:DNA-binding transcriptional LysR family regulator
VPGIRDAVAAATASRLQALVAVAEHGSVRAAAEALHVTAPAVSAAVGALEAQFGVPLLAREGRGVRLTDAGRTVADYARSVVGLLEEAYLAVAERGRLRLGAVTTAGESVLPPLLATFLAAHPDVALDLTVGPRDEVFAAARHHEVDVVVAGRPPAAAGLTTWARRANTLVVVAAPALADRAATATWLLRGPGSGTRAATLALIDRLGHGPATLTLGTQGAVVGAAVAGLGVTLVHADAVRTRLQAGDLVEVPVPGTPIDRPWHLAADVHPTPAARAFLAHVTGPAAGPDAFTPG